MRCRKKRNRARPFIFRTTDIGTRLVTKSRPGNWRVSFKNCREHSGHIGFLPRQRGLSGSRRRNCRRGPGRTLHPQKTRRRISGQRHSLLPGAGRAGGRARCRSYHVLRKAVSEIGAPSFHLSRVRPARSRFISQSDAGLDQTQNVDQTNHP